jgi:transposase-like protein
MLRCRTCGKAYSENHGTPFFQLNTPKDEVLRTLALIPEKGGIRAASRATGHDKNVISHWLDVAGEHCQKVNEYFLQDLSLDQVQIDEIWSYIKKRKASHQ